MSSWFKGIISHWISFSWVFSRHLRQEIHNFPGILQVFFIKRMNYNTAHKSHGHSPRQSASRWPPCEAALSDSAVATSEHFSFARLKEPSPAVAFFFAALHAQCMTRISLWEHNGESGVKVRGPLIDGDITQVFTAALQGNRTAVTCSMRMEMTALNWTSVSPKLHLVSQLVFSPASLEY